MSTVRSRDREECGFDTTAIPGTEIHLRWIEQSADGRTVERDDGDDKNTRCKYAEKNTHAQQNTVTS